MPSTDAPLERLFVATSWRRLRRMDRKRTSTRYLLIGHCLYPNYGYCAADLSKALKEIAHIKNAAATQAGLQSASKKKATSNKSVSSQSVSSNRFANLLGGSDSEEVEEEEKEEQKPPAAKPTKKSSNRK